MKTYLGDGVFAKLDPNTGEIILTTEDGILETNRIIIDAEIMHNLIFVLKRWGIKL